MPSWWGKSSSKDAKKKTSKESFIDTLHRKLKISFENKESSGSGGSQRCQGDAISEKCYRSPLESRSPSPSKKVLRCQSFGESTHAQPLPLPDLHPASLGFTDSVTSTKPKCEKGSKSSLFLPLPRPACIRSRTIPSDLDGELVTDSVFSESSTDSEDPADSNHSQATDFEIGNRTISGSPSK